MYHAGNRGAVSSMAPLSSSMQVSAAFMGLLIIFTNLDFAV